MNLPNVERKQLLLWPPIRVYSPIGMNLSSYTLKGGPSSIAPHGIWQQKNMTFLQDKYKHSEYNNKYKSIENP